MRLQSGSWGALQRLQNTHTPLGPSLLLCCPPSSDLSPGDKGWRGHVRGDAGEKNTTGLKMKLNIYPGPWARNVPA